MLEGKIVNGCGGRWREAVVSSDNKGTTTMRRAGIMDSEKATRHEYDICDEATKSVGA